VEKIAAWSDPIPLDEVKATGKAWRDGERLLLASVAGRSALSRRPGTISRALEFRAVVPVNLRGRRRSTSWGTDSVSSSSRSPSNRGSLDRSSS